MNTNTENEIERYLSGNMNAEEVKDFENKLASDKNFATEYSSTLLAHKFINQAGRLELKDKLESFDLEMESTSATKKVIPLWVKRTISVAAILIVFFGIYQFAILNSAMTSNKVYSSYFEVYTSPGIVRDAGPTDQINWKTATNFYRGKEFSNAIPYFEKSKDEIPVYLASFYLGMSFLAQEAPDYEKALESFDSVLNSDNDFKQQALWYKGLALLQLNKKEEALEIFQSIVNSEGYNYKKAKEIIDLKIKD